MALRCLWSLGRASVCRNVIPASGIHVGVLEMQPTKVPLTEEEKKLLEKLGEPDSVTRGYLNELYADFDVAAEKKREQRQEKKRIKEENRTNDPAKSHSASAIEANGIFSRSFHTSAVSSSDRGILSPSLKGRKKTFEDESRVIWDTQELVDYYPENQKVSCTEGVTIPHGKAGVFDIEVLVDLLRREKLQDLAVIEVSANVAYADHLVIGTMLSKRQGRAVAAFLKKLYKVTKHAKEPTLKIEGEDCEKWKVLDFGNIVLHLFDEPTREKYDLESLWTVGHEFDELTEGLAQDNDVQDVLSQHMAFVRSLSPATGNVS